MFVLFFVCQSQNVNIFVFLFPRNAELFMNYTLIQLEQMFANFYFILQVPVDRDIRNHAK
jgi:hypothetical protein